MGITMFTKRFCAYMIDIFLLCIVLGIMEMFLKSFINNTLLNAVIIQVFTLFYFAIQESSSYQATIGKRILGLVVCDINGYRIGLLRAILRNLCRYINLLIFALGYIFIIFTKKNQGLHDLISRTIVYDENNDFLEIDEKK